MKLIYTLFAVLVSTMNLGHAASLDVQKIEALTGLKGKLNEKEGVIKVSLPRTDLKVTSSGVRITPPMGLTAWAAFSGTSDHAMVMGDIVMIEDQVNIVMSAALDNGLEVTALHNHFFGDSPKIMFMHIGGMGEETKLAAAVGKVFGQLRDTASRKPVSSSTTIDPAKTSLNPKKIEEVIGSYGELKDGVYKVIIGRTTKMGGHEVGKDMGVNTWAAFAGSDEKAVVDGDFAMLETELQPVLKVLRSAGINIVAIHNHMTGESPRIMFLHFFGIGPTVSLAKGIKSALDTQK